MYKIYAKDRKEIWDILKKYNYKCRIEDLIKGFSYLEDREHKKQKIRYILKRLELEINQTIKVQIIEVKGIIEIIF